MLLTLAFNELIALKVNGVTRFRLIFRFYNQEDSQQLSILVILPSKY